MSKIKIYIIYKKYIYISALSKTEIYWLYTTQLQYLVFLQEQIFSGENNFLLINMAMSVMTLFLNDLGFELQYSKEQKDCFQNAL